MIQRALLFVAMLLAQGPSVIAQEVPVARLVGPFAETIRAEAPVSGVDVLGLVVFGDHMPRGAEDIFVRNPSGKAVSVCVEMVTRDGRYIASGTFDLPETAPAGYVRIPITERTRYRNILRAAALENFAVLARVGSCDQPAGAVIPTAWGAPSPPVGVTHFVVTVQGARTQAFLITAAGRSACTRIQEIRHTAFDAYCEMSVPPSPMSRIQVQVERCAFGECTRSPAVQITP